MDETGRKSGVVIVLHYTVCSLYPKIVVQTLIEGVEELLFNTPLVRRIKMDGSL